ncbi:AhpC-TSA-domain-containing protein [Viridothelium virens]|uniref:thioredoxin-dependent peroxiredoxin n=1 Tax=Viridothelium virens TaxID=1048519 RepID=A0A6A6HCE5_VIRVR|nr:AhpC-TSA-domain-containing protein [Viridothelium virens]
MVELRKRKPKEEAPAPPPKKKSGPKPKAPKEDTSKADVSKEDVASAVQEAAAISAPNGAAAGAKKGTTATGAPKVGDSIDLEDFGGEIETHDGEKTSLKQLVADSKSGVVIFTYPKASTPGCTTQACLFRDSYDPLTSTTGLTLYGLSTDSPKSNTNFRTKQSLPYTLLCDPAASLIAALGFKKAPKGTVRGVVVIEKVAGQEGQGKVLAAEAGGPAATVEVVRNAVMGKAKDGGGKGENEKEREDKEAAETATEVADSAAKVDGED